MKKKNVVAATDVPTLYRLRVIKGKCVSCEDCGNIHSHIPWSHTAITALHTR